jgi:dTMP kinase
MKRKGFFITFEGIDGCGKTTQLRQTEEYLKKHRLSPLVLREPGSTPVSEKIRSILLNKDLHLDDLSELMLYIAARAVLVRELVAPSINSGKIILCDRFYDSTTAYQGYGRGIDIGLLSRLNNLAVGQYKPNLTFLIDVDYKTSLTRRKKKSDRLESESKTFFNKVRHGFLEIGRKEKTRVKVIDGRQSIEKIFDEVEYWLRKKLKIT